MSSTESSGTDGRDDVLAAGARLSDGPLSALLFEGDAGIGKTAVVDEIRCCAATARQRVWSAAPAEAEVQMPFSRIPAEIACSSLTRWRS